MPARCTTLAERAEAQAHPRHVLDGVRSLLVLTYDYRTCQPDATQPGRGRVSRYAWGTDYHDIVRERLRRLEGFLLERAPQAAVRTVIDTAPLAEREFAQLAGLGWIGKNTLLLNKDSGSWFFLAALLTDQELEYDAAARDRPLRHVPGLSRRLPHGCLCRCLRARCPQVHQLPDDRTSRAGSAELRTGMGDWLFGCDVCQDVCPWNSKAPESPEPAFLPREGETTLDLIALFELDETAFRERFRHTPLWRPKRRGILRNAAIVLGNQRDRRAISALTRGLNDEERLVRGACAWALGQIDDAGARRALEERLAGEDDDEVRGEIEAARAADKQPAGKVS